MSENENVVGDTTKETQMDNSTYPVLPLRDVVIFPKTIMPLFVGRKHSLTALNRAMNLEKKIVLVAQKDGNKDSPDPSEVYEIGTIASVIQLLKLPDGSVKVLVEGLQRFEVTEFGKNEEDGYFCRGAVVEDEPYALESSELTSYLNIASDGFEAYAKVNNKIPSEQIDSTTKIQEPTLLADTIAMHLNLPNDKKQELLAERKPIERLEQVISLMGVEMDMIDLEKNIRARVKKQMEKSQREYYLNEQIKAIQRELDDSEESGDEISELTAQIEAAKMPAEANEKAMAEVKRLRQMSPMSAEATVVRNYLDWILKTPWSKKSPLRHDINRAKAILDEDHYGLEDVKDRILDFLAVQQRTRADKGTILCLVGPPGVGKTSLGQSIARATNRKFVRLSLGGVRDEADIRGHRRTYIGSMPGKLIQSMSKAGTTNPMMMLDEIDKMSSDFRGDPSAAMLEVLDPEQNKAFGDHFLEVDYNLSKVMFVATANTLNISGPLLDRMEVIRISGYTEQEKVEIARRYLLPKQIKANGLRDGELELADEHIRTIVQRYTREAGVRELERQLGKVCRKAVRRILSTADETNKKTDTRKGKSAQKAKKSKKVEPVIVDTDLLREMLGVERFNIDVADKKPRVGVVTGLAWTSVGGELLNIEAVNVAGKGKYQYTGKLGDVMKESIQTAMTVVRSRANTYGLKPELFDQRDIHVHVPEGATPKDGPSAGIAMCTAILSSLSKVPVRHDVAMTGEITLQGQVLPIGGLKEKILAAVRGGIREIIIPEDNRKDLAEIPDEMTENVSIHCVSWIDEVLDYALELSGGSDAVSVLTSQSSIKEEPATPITH